MRPLVFPAVFRLRIAALAVTIVLLPAVVRAQATSFQLPLDNYPADDNCGPWGFYNPNFQRCGLPGRHVADDACAPNGTEIHAVADGVVRYATTVGNCSTNWGWLTVMEHVLPDGSRVCSVYGHCQPRPDIALGMDVVKGQAIATINMPCGAAHIHFGLYAGAWGTWTGNYPDWLLGYLPNDATCNGYPVLFPGLWVDPVAFIQDHVPVQAETWGAIKAVYR